MEPELPEELLRCRCAVSVELREVLEGTTDRPQLLRSWGRYLAWHTPEPDGPLARLAVELGLPDSSGVRVPGTEV